MTLNQLISFYGMDKLNSATKYPSILTYHATGDKGTLKPELNGGFDFDDSPVILTEKVDGTNARILFDETGDFILGSREDFIYAKGDRVWPLKQPILNELLPRGLDSILAGFPPQGITVLFGEVYGERINAGYTQSHGFLLFDVMLLDPAMLALPSPEIAMWRENGGQAFRSQNELDVYASLAPRVPALHKDRAFVEAPPASLEDTYRYMRHWLPDSGVGGVKAPEGIIARTSDRRIIRKLRFQDYERTFKRMGVSV